MKSNNISSNRHTYCIGEVLWDIIFENGNCTGGHVGGAMLNTAVTLSRAGLSVDFISVLSNDDAGNEILNFLKQNDIKTDYLLQNENIQSTLALAFINQNGDAKYSFYKDELDSFMFKMPDFNDSDIVLFGSGWARGKVAFGQIYKLLEAAKRKSALIIYDPNYRKKDRSASSEVVHMCKENIASADIVRGSDEDFYNLFGCKTGLETFQQINNLGCNQLIYTKSSSHIECFWNNQFITLPVKNVDVINTVGAGDNFNAGIIAALHHKKIKTRDLPLLREADLLSVLDKGRNWGSAVCRLKENYLSKKMLDII